MSLASENNLTTQVENVVGSFREPFESFTNGVKWNLTQGSDDIVRLDGNAGGSSYLVISKGVNSAGTETVLETIDSFPIPCEVSVGLHMSQRMIGQEVSMELVSTDAGSPYTDVAISSISQSSTNCTVTTSTPHGLAVGKRVGIRGVTDTRLNYPAAVVSAVLSPTQFIISSYPGGFLPSISLGPYTNQGYVFFRPAMGYANDGVSLIFETSNTTTASYYVKSAAGDAFPSGGISTNHAITTGSTASITNASGQYTYALSPTTEYRFYVQDDKVVFQEQSVDSTNGPTTRLVRTQIVPDPNKRYKLRFRVNTTKSMSSVVATCLTHVKSGGSIGTVTTAQPHGLTVGEYVYIYGAKDTNYFLTTGLVQVISTPTSTTFTANYGLPTTATTYGGVVIRANGQVTMPGAQNSNPVVTVSTSTITNELTAQANSGWGVSFNIGDYITIAGVVNTSGTSVGVDGDYTIANVIGSQLTLVPIDGRTLPAVSSTSTGGMAIKRTDLRLSYVRISDYLRQRFEVIPTAAAVNSIPVQVNNTPTVSATGSLTPINTNTFNVATTTNLLSAATFTGNATNLAASSTSSTIYNTNVVIGVNHQAGLTQGTLCVDYGTETSSTNPTTWYTGLTVPIPSSAAWHFFTVQVPTRFYRVRFINGSTAQTNFRLSTLSNYNGGDTNLSFPQNIQYPLSVTALTGGASFTSGTFDFGESMNPYQTFTAIAYADQPSATGGFKIQLSRNGTDWRDATTTTTAAGVMSSITSHISLRYLRVVFTNDASAQGTLHLDAHADTK